MNWQRQRRINKFGDDDGRKAHGSEYRRAGPVVVKVDPDVLGSGFRRAGPVVVKVDPDVLGSGFRRAGPVVVKVDPDNQANRNIR
jgi:hypothetical protein